MGRRRGRSPRDPTAANVSAHSGQPVWSRVARDGQARLVQRAARRAAATCPCAPEGAACSTRTSGTTPRGNVTSSTPAAPACPGAAATSGSTTASTCKERKVPGASTATLLGVRAVGLARLGRVRAHGPGQVQRPVRRAARQAAQARQPRAGRDRPARRAASPTCSSRRATRSAARSGCARCATRRSRVVVTASRRRARATASPARCSTGRYIYWLQRGPRAQRVLRGPRARRPRSSPLEFTRPHVPRRASTRSRSRASASTTRTARASSRRPTRGRCSRRAARISRADGDDGSPIGKQYPPSSTRWAARRSASTRTRWARPTPSTTIPRRHARPAFATSSRRRCSASSTRPARWARRSSTPSSGINLMMMVHGAQEFEWCEPVVRGRHDHDHGDAQGHVREERHEVLRIRVRVHEPGRADDREGQPGPTS